MGTQAREGGEKGGVGEKCVLGVEIGGCFVVYLAVCEQDCGVDTAALGSVEGGESRVRGEAEEVVVYLNADFGGSCEEACGRLC